MKNEYDIVPAEGADVPTILDEMADLYDAAYSEAPYNSGALWNRNSFIDRTRRQSSRPGYSLLVARDPDQELIGYAFGLPFEPGKWWAGQASAPPDEILSASKFAVIELIVRRDWRNRGVGRHLLDTLLRDREEDVAILTAHPDAPARKYYEHWGWFAVGSAQHMPDSPALDALALSLN